VVQNPSKPKQPRPSPSAPPPVVPLFSHLPPRETQSTEEMMTELGLNGMFKKEGFKLDPYYNWLNDGF